jgi:hypothetical protein
MNGTKIDELAESVWRRVIGYEHACGLDNTGDPDDCPLFREIHDEITMWATKQTKEDANG